jgi:hypothetical protein
VERVEVAPRILEVSKRLSSSVLSWTENRYKQGLLFDYEIDNPDLLNLLYDREDVAFHEVGHELAGRSVGWTLISETVKADGNRRGSTMMLPNRSRSEPQLLLDAITVSAGGEMAEDMCNIHDHSGCGSDRFKQRYLARIYQLMTRTTESMDSIIGSQKSRARALISSYGFGYHLKRSFQLNRAVTI